ncbi:hypothetical protein CC80DRAFT_538739 [Byssothecium circinans]|uniref:Uncharacterized protein n=1 Tax=Byssothecium circinans TaxID=147558 RepID=A0A6A5TJ51_9PLEO|nr:hypothetical protein CC80DRAFT_538739 [Byssothecium circinans]
MNTTMNATMPSSNTTDQTTRNPDQPDGTFILFLVISLITFQSFMFVAYIFILRDQLHRSHALDAGVELPALEYQLLSSDDCIVCHAPLGDVEGDPSLPTYELRNKGPALPPYSYEPRVSEGSRVDVGEREAFLSTWAYYNALHPQFHTQPKPHHTNSTPILTTKSNPKTSSLTPESPSTKLTQTANSIMNQTSTMPPANTTLPPPPNPESSSPHLSGSATASLIIVFVPLIAFLLLLYLMYQEHRIAPAEEEGPEHGGHELADISPSPEHSQGNALRSFFFGCAGRGHRSGPVDARDESEESEGAGSVGGDSAMPGGQRGDSMALSPDEGVFVLGDGSEAEGEGKEEYVGVGRKV